MNASGSNGAPAMARIWSEMHQIAFARATGDVNPMHMDARTARRTVAGGRAVHGVHAALWALDACAASYSLENLSTLQVRFERFVLVGDRAEITIQEASAERLRLSVSVGDLRSLTIQATFGEKHESGEPIHGVETEIPEIPIIIEPSAIIGRAGAFRIVDPAAVCALAPRLTRDIGPNRVATIGSLSTLVGMIVPGLHSILSKIYITLTNESHEASLSYAVKRFQPMLQSVTVRATGPGINAHVESFMRPRPVEQTSLHELKGLVHQTEFAGVSALIIGGSRGLGATTAKLIAAGGGAVCITYMTGSAEAEAVAGEIQQAGGHCKVLRYDAGVPVGEQLSLIGMKPSQLYHFATPRIFRQKRAPFEQSICDEMMQIYNYSFYEICQLCLKNGRRLSAFYPSTIAINEAAPDTLEYATAKAAGETMAIIMDKVLPNLRVLIERLPRIQTDQTATIFPVPAASPSAIMLPIIREMCN